MPAPQRSTITWTDYSAGDANFVLRGKRLGDCEASTGCQNCYAHLQRQRDPKRAPDETTVNESKLKSLIRFKPKEKGTPYRRGPGSRPMIFVCDLGDLFHDNVPDDFIMGAIRGMGSRTDIDFQILTKRAERMAGLLTEVPDNVWVGITAENQDMAEKRLPHLLRIKAKVRFLSVEPMLESMTIPLDGIHWVICGAESGPGRRPFDKSWASSLYQQCQEHGVSFFFKQGSHFRPGRDDFLDGEQVKQWPAE
jgi:protein gp37